MAATNGIFLGQGKASTTRRKRFKSLPKFNACRPCASHRYAESRDVPSQTLIFFYLPGNMPSLNWMHHGVSTDSSTSKNPTESIAGNHRGSFMHGAGDFKAGWDKWCGMDVRVGIFFPPLLSRLCFLIDLWYISLVLFSRYFLTCQLQAIAVHTFSVLVLRWNPPKYASKAMVIGVWVLTALIIGIPNAVHRNQHYYGASGYCKSTFRFSTNC
jgi:hypothetical protein